jgi:two-component system, LytTR family, response regulator
MTARAKMKILVVDDEPLARARIIDLLSGRPETEIAGQAESGAEAVDLIRRLRPDLVFLDIQMPELDGFGVVDAVGPNRNPIYIFITAYDRFALQAFEVHAFDYILKPIDPVRFDEAFRRAVARWRGESDGDAAGGTYAEAVDKLLAGVRGEGRLPERIAVRSKGGIRFVRADEVDWIEAASNYAVLHAGPAEHVVRTTMADLEKRLDPRKFVRAHRSAIVNLEAVREIQPLFHGDSVLLLRGGARVTLGRAFREKVLQSLSLI